MGAVYDVHATQTTSHPERGIARSVLDLALALEARHAADVSAYSYLPDHALPDSLAGLAAAGRLVPADRLRRGATGVFHVGSVFEGASLHDLVPAAVRTDRTALAVTLHDLIPLRYPDEYLRDPWARRRYTTRLELVRSADLVLAISEHTAREGVDLLGLRPARVVVTGLAPSDRFTPAPAGHDPLARLAAALPGVRPGFVLYPGGTDPRKNLTGLVRAYALLDPALRRAHRLVVACRLDDEARADLVASTHRLGIAEDVVATGLVPDDVLLELYRAAFVVVFPSLHEGYGLPVMEARRCGAPVLAARTSALVELLPDEALFDPSSPPDIARAIEAGLTDPGHRARLGALPEPPGHTWPEVAARTADAYRSVQARRARRRRAPVPRVGVVSPLPPAPTGVADHTARLAEALAHHVTVEVFTSDPAGARAPAGVGVHSVEHLVRAQAGRGAFDGLVHAWGNSRWHAGMLPVMREWPGLVLAHDVGVAGLYEWCGDHEPDLVGGTLADVLARQYRGDLPAGIDPATTTHGTLDQHGVTLAREVVGWSERYLVHSEAAAELARRDLPPHLHERVGVLSFAVRSGRPRSRPDRVGRPPIVASFGVTQASKQVEPLIDAFALVHAADPRVQLVFVGEVLFGVRRRIHERAAAAGIDHAVRITGRVPLEQYEDWLTVADVAVQLRAGWNGESSAALGDALAWGVPTIATDVGATRELPDAAVVKVPADVDADALATAITRLLTDPGRRAALSTTAVAHAAEHTFARTALELLEQLELVSRGGAGARGRCGPAPGTPASPG